MKEKARNIGGLGTVLRKRHNKVRQDRKNALKNNWQFVYRIATAAMIIGKLKKSTEESNKLVHDSGIADYESFLNTINLPIEKRTESHIYKIARMVRPLKFFKDLNKESKPLHAYSYGGQTLGSCSASTTNQPS